MVGPPEHGDLRLLQLLEEAGDGIDLGAPLLVQLRAGGQHVLELLVRELALDAGQFLRGRWRRAAAGR